MALTRLFGILSRFQKQAGTELHLFGVPRMPAGGEGKLQSV